MLKCVQGDKLAEGVALVNVYGCKEQPCNNCRCKPVLQIERHWMCLTSPKRSPEERRPRGFLFAGLPVAPTCTRFNPERQRQLINAEAIFLSECNQGLYSRASQRKIDMCLRL